MLRFYRSASLLCFLTLCLASPTFAQPFATPQQAVETYITAVKTGSGQHIDMAFAASASIQYYNEQGEYRAYTRDAFSALVNSGNNWDALIEISELKVTGNAANATVEFTWGKDDEKGYVDYLNLIYDGESWRITDKVAQYVDR